MSPINMVADEDGKISMKKLLERISLGFLVTLLVVAAVGVIAFVPLLIEGFYYHNSTCIGWALVCSLGLPVSGLISMFNTRRK